MNVFKQLYHQFIDNFAPMWFLRLQYSERYIIAQQNHIRYLEQELSIRGSDLNDAIAKWEWHRDRADRFHRRAQKAEGMLQSELVPGLQELINLHQHNARVFKAHLVHAESNLQKVYPYLHIAWLHKMASKPETQDIKAANAIAALEAELRSLYPGIHIPPKPETFNKG
jgi:hypothetical protein